MIKKDGTKTNSNRGVRHGKFIKAWQACTPPLLKMRRGSTALAKDLAAKYPGHRTWSFRIAAKRMPELFKVTIDNRVTSITRLR